MRGEESSLTRVDLDDEWERERRAWNLPRPRRVAVTERPSRLVEDPSRTAASGGERVVEWAEGAATR
jgi:hypothetical protein